MTIRTRTLPIALLLFCAACQGPNPADPMGGDDNVDPWAGTAWATWFQEAKDMGGRADLVVVEDQGFAIRPVARPEQWAFAEPTCSVSDGPGVVEARRYLECLDDRVLGDPKRMTHDESGERIRSIAERHYYFITWEPDDSKWHVWTSPVWGCANATRAAMSAGTIRLR